MQKVERFAAEWNQQAVAPKHPVPARKLERIESQPSQEDPRGEGFRIGCIAIELVLVQTPDLVNDLVDLKQ